MVVSVREGTVRVSPHFYTMGHQDEAVAAFGKVSDKPKASVARQQLDTTLSLLTTPRSKGRPFGWMAPDDWRESINFLEEYGGVAKFRYGRSRSALRAGQGHAQSRPAQSQLRR